MHQQVDGVEYTEMPNTNRRRKSNMASAPLKRKSAIDTLLESIDELAVSAAKNKSTEEVREVRRSINDVVDRAVDRKPRRETA
jgi:hypothetical protein